MTDRALYQSTRGSLGDLVCLIGHLGRLSLWESSWEPRAKRIARRRADERRRKIIRELSAGLSRTLQRQLGWV